jgi:hypothetical protein
LATNTQTLENQISHVAFLVHKIEANKGRLPFHAKINLKKNACSMALRSGKEVQTKTTTAGT